MISDSELVERLREFLRNSDLNTTTTASVRRRLEEDFGVDLSEKKAFIREQVDLFLQSQLENVKDEEAEENEEEDPEEVEEVEEEEEEEDEPANNGKDRRKRGSNKPNKENKRRGGGFTKLCSLSPQLQEFVGASELARTEVVKQLWAYIRENNLQDPSNKRNIICDETLHALFNVDSINMFQMNKVLSKHIWPLASEDAGPVKTVQKEKPRKRDKDERKQDRDEDDSLPKGKRQKGGSSGFLAPIPLSDALVKFIGTGESALSRSDVVKRMWDYIKENKLQVWKLNFDESSRGNPGPAVIRGIVRDWDGRIITRFAGPLGISTSNEAEIWALCEGLILIGNLCSPPIIFKKELHFCHLLGQVQIRP